MLSPESDRDAGAVKRAPGMGCAVAVIVLNALLIGPLAAMFALGSYSSWEQELWYRYGALGFLVCGVVLPAAVLVSRAGRSALLIAVSTIWMLAALVAFSGYLFMSGGGV